MFHTIILFRETAFPYSWNARNSRVKLIPKTEQRPKRNEELSNDQQQ